MLAPYLPIVILFALGFGFAAFNVLMSAMLGPKRYNKAKLDFYECGIEPTPQPLGPHRFPIKYFLTAMLFIVFDIEIIFLYPYAVVYQRLGGFGLAEIIVFAVPVFASFLFLIANGALDWGPVKRGRSIDPQVSELRTSESTIRRVGLEGRQEPGAAA